MNNYYFSLQPNLLEPSWRRTCYTWIQYYWARWIWNYFKPFIIFTYVFQNGFSQVWKFLQNIKVRNQKVNLSGSSDFNRSSFISVRYIDYKYHNCVERLWIDFSMMLQFNPYRWYFSFLLTYFFCINLTMRRENREYKEIEQTGGNMSHFTLHMYLHGKLLFVICNQREKMN